MLRTIVLAETGYRICGGCILGDKIAVVSSTGVYMCSLLLDCVHRLVFYLAMWTWDLLWGGKWMGFLIVCPGKLRWI